MKLKESTAGNTGKSSRSDCFVKIKLTENDGLILNIKSKVQANFGNKIESLIRNILKFYEIENAIVDFEDQGALDFVISARIEAAIKKIIDTKKDYLPEFINENKLITKRDQNRFSRLYLPGNNPKLMLNSGIHYPNGVILDLEDAVAPAKKYEARFIVRNALRAVNFYGAERMVRINQGELAFTDLEYIIPQKPNLILIPKCENAEQIHNINAKINELKDYEQGVWLMPIIESATGIENAFNIANSSDTVVAMAIGLEDFTADLGAQRTNEAKESFYARTRMVNACKAAGIQAIDSVFSDVNDMQALALNVQESKSLGFDGMGCIHPRQIKVIHDNFAPDNDEIKKACKIVDAFIKAEEKGLGVVSLGSKMIDAPVVKRAQKTVDLAISLGIINENWRDDLLNENK